ncbi:DUF4198 domain-containing protein [Marinoscillum furvescens]|uniref:Prealbumin-like fold domain-containing protein n=1 Tax=Marinoscillum furvescens DSM 4134 TaxID=1122208 RepID=A0A3D9L176_MARFU|nr:DUF4198 domain-containing protein [Marinoscillum furvescens]RED97050.1 hypothetical protein C7460_11399 [Marinoscillum furvescens DSM 4134]
MKYILFILSAILMVGLFSFKPANTQLLPTKLKITVLDGLGNPTEGVQVKIFKSEEEYRKDENPVAIGLTDEKGRVTFKDVEPISYFIDARKGDMNNDGEGVQTAILQEGRTNKLNTVIE